MCLFTVITNIFLIYFVLLILLFWSVSVLLAVVMGIEKTEISLTIILILLSLSV